MSHLMSGSFVLNRWVAKFQAVTPTEPRTCRRTKETAHASCVPKRPRDYSLARTRLGVLSSYGPTASWAVRLMRHVILFSQKGCARRLASIVL